MRRRYDLRRSDNYPYNGKISYVCSGSGSIFVYTGFPVKSALVSWSVYPFAQDEEMSSSSETSSSSTEVMSSSSLSSISLSMSTESTSSSSSESSSSLSEIISGLPRIYVSGYLGNGFTVAYENIPPQVGYIEFGFTAS